MKIYHIYILIIILFSYCGIDLLHAQEGYELEDISFSGNESFSDDELISQTSLYTLSWFEKTILRKEKFLNVKFLENKFEKKSL